MPSNVTSFSEKISALLILTLEGPRGGGYHPTAFYFFSHFRNFLFYTLPHLIAMFLTIFYDLLQIGAPTVSRTRIKKFAKMTCQNFLALR